MRPELDKILDKIYVHMEKQGSKHIYSFATALIKYFRYDSVIIWVKMNKNFDTNGIIAVKYKDKNDIIREDTQLIYKFATKTICKV